MPKRSLDTSNMFRTMAGKSEPNEYEKKEIVPHPVVENDIPSTEEKAGDVSQVKKAKRKSKAMEDEKNRQTIKLGFYLTPNNYAALKLHIALMGKSNHQDSKIVNQALTQYLSKELEVLDSLPDTLSEEERFSKALKALL